MSLNCSCSFALTQAMNQDVKQKWIAALRSGDYKQTREQLRRNGENSYCCLGVLTDLYDKDETVGSEDHWCGDLYSYTCEGAKYKAESVLPQPVMEWAGLKDYNPSVKYSRDTTDSELDILSLAYLNDHEYLSFEQIANLIEEQY